MPHAHRHQDCTLFSSGTWVAPMRTGYRASLNFISMPTSVLPTTSLASGCSAFSASSDALLVGLHACSQLGSAVDRCLLLHKQWSAHRRDAM